MYRQFYAPILIIKLIKKETVSENPRKDSENPRKEKHIKEQADGL